MYEELIQQARELCEKATPGPWELDGDVWHGDMCIAEINDPSNAAFIATSRTLVPQLCDALEEEISRRYQAECNYDHWKAQAEKAEAERDTFKLELSHLEHMVSHERSGNGKREHSIGVAVAVGRARKLLKGE